MIHMVYSIAGENCMENLMFDYHSFGKKFAIPMEIVEKFEKEAQNEFPFDDMLMEIHILRALKAYTKTSTLAVTIET